MLVITMDVDAESGFQPDGRESVSMQLVSKKGRAILCRGAGRRDSMIS
jgi:hypothetical protein